MVSRCIPEFARKRRCNSVQKSLQFGFFTHLQLLVLLPLLGREQHFHRANDKATFQWRVFWNALETHKFSRKLHLLIYTWRSDTVLFRLCRFLQAATRSSY